jgi:hypothetical protein
MKPALENFVRLLHVRRIDDADGIERALRVLNECADEYGMALEFIDAATWIAKQPVPTREKYRAICELAAVPDDARCDLSVVGRRIEVEPFEAVQR